MSSRIEEKKDFKYEVFKSDLKNKKLNNIDPKRAIWDKKIEDEYYNTNYDTFEHRILECIKDGGKILDLKYLDLTEFPSSEFLKKFKSDLVKNLEEIYISNNKIKEIPADMSIYKSLRVLDLSLNQLTQINCILPETLIEITCHNNFIEKFSLSNTKSLRILDINNNNITTITNLENIKNLEVLLAHYNKIKEIPSLLKLRKLVINNNHVENLINFTSLVYLDCSNCNIKKIENVPKIRDLLCSNNQYLSKLVQIPNVKYLEIINTNIKKLDYFENLHELICNYNQITEISNKYKVTSARKHKDKLLHILFNNE